jgi:hypothetical protein
MLLGFYIIKNIRYLARTTFQGKYSHVADMVLISHEFSPTKI